MKKLTSITLVFCLLLSLFAFAANAETASITVTVTIADKTGQLVLAAEPVEVRDVDGDGTFTVHDTLTCAHVQYYGSADGYEAEASVVYDGLSLVKLWGETNNYCFGYYRNDASCWSLLDEVKAGDRVTAFAYRDAQNWSDVYTFCEPAAAEVKTGKLLKLTVKKAGYDEQWNPVELPVVGATITVDGGKTRFVTDEKGEVRIFLNDEGEHLISVVSDTELLVPFAVKVQVTYNTLSYVQGLLLSVLYPVVNWILHLFNK